MVRHNGEVYAGDKGGYPRFWNRIRGQKVLEILKPETGDRILEIGCDTGWLVRKLMGYSENVVGIDVNDEGLKIANMRNLFCMDIANTGFRDNSFDKIICLHAIEHVQEIDKAFEEMSRVLKPAGNILLMYPFEIVRGISAMGSAWALCPSTSKAGELHIHSLSKARKLHIHKLYPRRIAKLVEGNGLYLKGSVMFMDPWLSYLTIMEKRRYGNKHNSSDAHGSESIGHVWVRNSYAGSFA